MTQLMNLAFIGPLKHAGLSLSIGLAACLNAALLYWQLRKQDIFQPQPGWMGFLLRLFIAVGAVALGILAGPLTVALFQYGKFTAFDAAMTQRALIAYSVGLMGLIVVKVLAPGFYSRQDIKTPVKIAFLVSGSVSWMYYADRLMEFPSGVLGVALGTILLPSLAKSFSSGNQAEYSRLMDWGLRLCFLLALPWAWAVVVGGVLQLGYQLPHLKKIGMLVLPRINLRDAGVWRVMRQMGPAILGVSVSQISLIINTIFA
ncbi:hypothetical protein CRX72_14830 [Pantoea sp. BRM17]|nr:hypothetical protein CRX72_14830 [Pantoea sp. BRM17]